MTHTEVFTLLQNLNIPVAYDHFDSNKQITPPFVVYRQLPSNTFKADGITYYNSYNYEIELITEKKNIALENQIKGLLTNNNIPYDEDDEIWDVEEKIYHNFYII